MNAEDHAREVPALVMVRSGPADPDLPYRYGCSCGAIWNASAPHDSNRKALCGPFCSPKLFALDSSSGDQP